MPASNPASVDPLISPRLSARRGRLISTARLVLILIAFVVLGLFIAGIPARFSDQLTRLESLSLLDIGLSSGVYAGIVLGVDFLVILAHIGIAGVILWRRPYDWIALFVAFTLVISGGALPIATRPPAPSCTLFGSFWIAA